MLNDENYVRNVESRRLNVIQFVEEDYKGSSQVVLPAIIVDMTTKEVLEKYDMFKVIELSRLYDLFLTGMGVGERREIKRRMSHD